MAKSEVVRQRKSRRAKLAEQLKRDGWASVKECQDECRRLDVPWTWSNRKLEDGVATEDLLPSRKVLDTARSRSKKP